MHAYVLYTISSIYFPDWVFMPYLREETHDHSQVVARRVLPELYMISKAYVKVIHTNFPYGKHLQLLTCTIRTFLAFEKDICH